MRDSCRLRAALLLVLTSALLGLVAVPAGAATVTQVARTVSLQAGSTTAYATDRVSFAGRLSKSPKGSKVKLQRKQGASWTTLTVVSTTTKKGAYVAAVAMPTTPGAQQFRTLAPARKVVKNGVTRKLRKAVSAAVTVTVEPRPVPPVAAAPVIATTALPDGEVGTAYVADLDLVTAMGGTWSVVPSLPVGLTLDPATGGLGGTPATDGASSLTFSFTPTAAGTVATKALSLTIAPEPAPPAPAITTTHLADGYATQAYSQTLTVDDPGPGTWTVTTALSGFAIDATTGELTGTSATPGDHELVIRFTRSADGLFDEETFDLRLDPVPGPPGPPAVTIDGGGVHACRILGDSTLWCWGNQGKGAVGIGPVALPDVKRLSPEQVGTSTWRQVSAATEAVQAFTCGIQADHSLWCWGSASYGQLGLGASGSQQDSPVLVDDTRHWAQVSAGEAHACATTLGGKLFCWGGIATGNAGGATVPTEVDPGGATWTSVSAGGSHTCAIRSPGTMWCWGYNSRGQLGTGGPTSGSTGPVQVGTATDWTSLSAGAAHTCALRASDLYCWGRNDVGAVGSGTPGTDVTTPAQVSGSWATVAASGSGNSDHTCAVDSAGRLWCWGSGGEGKLGNGGTDDKAVPTQVGTDTTWASATAGGSFSCAVKVDDTQWCWGGNSSGEVGTGSSAATFPTPQQVSS